MKLQIDWQDWDVTEAELKKIKSHLKSLFKTPATMECGFKVTSFRGEVMGVERGSNNIKRINVVGRAEGAFYHHLSQTEGEFYFDLLFTFKGRKSDYEIIFYDFYPKGRKDNLKEKLEKCHLLIAYRFVNTEGKTYSLFKVIFIKVGTDLWEAEFSAEIEPYCRLDGSPTNCETCFRFNRKDQKCEAPLPRLTTEQVIKLANGYTHLIFDPPTCFWIYNRKEGVSENAENTNDRQ